MILKILNANFILKVILFFPIITLAQQTKPGEVIPDSRPGTFKGVMADDLKDAKPSFPITRKAASDAPNVVLILLDDVGFGASSTFGGPIPTPTADQLAANGLKYTQWHTTALCSPSRASLLTGKNHHEAGFGVISEIATGFPGYNGVISDNSATIGEILKDNGYNTSWFGKNHNTPDYETSQAGPFIQWPNNMGFEYFYGFNGGDCNQLSPPLIENTSVVIPPNDPNYNLTTDLTNHAISWVRNQKAAAPNKPFFIYFAPGATHAPHQPPKEWSAKFKGKFDQGWNKVSEETFERMKKMNIIPQNTKYNPIPTEIGEWDKLNADQKKVYSRMMEIYAGYLAYVDDEVGRMLKAIDELGQSNNTLVIYAIGDNGASAEGGVTGTLNEIAADFNSYRPDVVKDALTHLDDIGGPTTYNHYPAAWAVAMNSPMKYAKRQASHFGGTRNGLVISWPKTITDKGGLRTQFSHCNDIVPTILEAAGIPQPKIVKGVKQTPMSGTSMVYSFNAANSKVPTKHTVQYFEMGGGRAIYKDGWVAAATHGFSPWTDDRNPKTTLDNDIWELYDITKDFSEHDDVASQFPDKLNELKKAFLTEAKKYQVLPIDDRGPERLNAKVAGRPAGAIEGMTHFTYYDGTIRIPEGSSPDVKNRSFSVTADVEIKDGKQEGVIITQGGLFAGWGLLVKDGKPVFIYNWLQEQITNFEGQKTLTPGKHIISFDFTYDGGGMGKGGNGVLKVDGNIVAEKHIEKTVPFRFSLDETMDVGMDLGTPVSLDYKTPFKFTGKINKVNIDLK